MTVSSREYAPFTRRLLTGLCLGSLALNIGCYSYQPVQSAPPALSERVSVTVNDRGRVLLADRIGPVLDRVEGRLVSADSSNVVLLVTRAIDLRGRASNWTGEQVTIPREAILGFQARPFSRGRTFALVAAIVGGLTALALSISLAVSGSGLKDAGPGGGSGQS